jgi:hypothetical protein
MSSLEPCLSFKKLGWLSKGPPESSAHPIPVTKSGVLGHLIDRMLSALDHDPRFFRPQPLNRLGGRPSGLGAEEAAELARA